MDCRTVPCQKPPLHGVRLVPTERQAQRSTYSLRRCFRTPSPAACAKARSLAFPGRPRERALSSRCMAGAHGRARGLTCEAINGLNLSAPENRPRRGNGRPPITVRIDRCGETHAAPRRRVAPHRWRGARLDPNFPCQRCDYPERRTGPGTGYGGLERSRSNVHLVSL